MYDHQIIKKANNITNSPESKQRTKNISTSPVKMQKQQAIQKDRFSPGSLTQSAVLQLQRTIGNKATARLLLETGAMRIHHPVQREAVPGLVQMMPASGIIQRQEGEEEELQLMPASGAIQRQEGEEEELQMMPASGAIQRQEGEEEEDLQMMPAGGTIQRQEGEEDKNLQMKRDSIFQRKEIEIPVKKTLRSFDYMKNPLATRPRINAPSLSEPLIQKKDDPVPERRENNTGMPDNLKTGLETLSGLDLSDVRVHRSSNKPSQVSALAYTQGTDIYIAPGQEQHLPHEGWHAVQQKQGRVQATTQAAGLPVNDEPALENEADVMGEKALQKKLEI